MANKEKIGSALAILWLFSTISVQFNNGSTAVRGPCHLASICKNSNQGKSYGEIVIGGLFPVHKAERDDEGVIKCEDTSRALNEYGFERLEAMRYAVLRANREKLLGDIKISYEMKDTCQERSHALRQSVSFLNIGSTRKQDYRFTVGVVGAASSSISIAVTDLLNLFGVPLVSYASTSAALSDSLRYPSFFRTVPPDRFQSKAMVDIVRNLGWRYVHTASSTDAYGKDGIRSFIEAARAAKIDIGAQLELSRGTEDVKEAREAVQMKVRKTLSNLPSNDPLSRGNLMVIFAQLDVAKNVMAAIKNTIELKDRMFTFIVSDSSGDKVESVYDPHENISNIAVAKGMLSVIPESIKVKELEEHMKSLNPNSYSRDENPWFAQYWEKRFGCNPLTGTNYSVTKCRTSNSLATVTLDSKVAYVIDAVNVFVYALRNMLMDKCEGKVEMCGRAISCFKEWWFCSNELRGYIENVSFDAQSGEEFQFDSAGDFVQAKYDIKNLHVDKEKSAPENIEFVSVGTWQLRSGKTSDQEALYLNSEKLVWITDERGVENAPVSNCSGECTPGQVKDRMLLGKGREYFTCWTCRDCVMDHQYVSYETDEYGECKLCPSDSTTNDLRTGCIKLDVQYLRYGDGLSIFVIILAVVGIASVTTTFAAFFAKWNTPVVVASSRELSVVLLLGLLLCFLSTSVFIGEPTDVTCGIRRFCPVVFLSMVYGPLLIKTNRIYRIFSHRAMVQRPPFISPFSQLVFTGIIVVISCCIAAVWLLISPPEAETHVETPNIKVVRTCKNHLGFGNLITSLWIFTLIIVCAYYGFRTRKIPENYRETMFISFAAYSELIIWLAFAPFGFISLDDQYVTVIVILAVMLNALAAWGCLFVPKLYIVLLRPERNKRHTAPRSNTRNGMSVVSTPKEREVVSTDKETSI